MYMARLLGYGHSTMAMGTAEKYAGIATSPTADECWLRAATERGRPNGKTPSWAASSTLLATSVDNNLALSIIYLAADSAGQPFAIPFLVPREYEYTGVRVYGSVWVR